MRLENGLRGELIVAGTTTKILAIPQDVFVFKEIG